MLDIMHQMHIDFLGKAIENLGGFKDPLKFETKARFVSRFSFWQHVHHTRVVKF